MKDNIKYFKTHEGEHKWRMDLSIKGFSKFLKADIAALDKIKFTLFMMIKKSPLNPKMITKVSKIDDNLNVSHFTKIWLGPITLYKSNKNFSLNPNGSDLTITGVEYFFPKINTEVSFKPLSGQISENGTKANYKMPMLGTICNASSNLKEGNSIGVETSWLKARFTLD